MSADVVPPVRGEVPFSPTQMTAEDLAGALGLAPESVRVPGSVDYVPPSLADQLVGEQQIAKPRITEQNKMKLETPQPERLHLTPSPSEKQAPKITHSVDKGGQHTVRAEGGGEITAKALPDQGRLQIVSSSVPKGLRGQGRGQALAMRLLQEAKKRGLKLVSDIRVSEPAQNMWKALEKRGVQIKRNPAEKQASGELVSKSELKPVFEVIGTAATE
jgi:predicted GNAT family acetyltransferase